MRKQMKLLAGWLWMLALEINFIAKIIEVYEIFRDPRGSRGH